MNLNKIHTAKALNYSVSLGWFFTDLPLLDRFQVAKEAGFQAVEMFWTDEDPQRVAEAAAQAGVRVVLFNMNEGDYAAGDRGFACDPYRRDEWRQDLDRALVLAKALGCRRINVLSGDVPPGQTREEAHDVMAENLRWAAPRAEATGVTLVVEPLTHLTHPIHLCQRTEDVLHLLDKVGDERIKLQFDTFHAQSSEGNLITTIREHIDRIGHIQVADVPTRAQPGTGEINFTNLLRAIADAGYDGHIGLEYSPEDDPAPFAWLFPEDGQRPVDADRKILQP